MAGQYAMLSLAICEESHGNYWFANPRRELAAHADLLQCISPVLALSGHARRVVRCLLLGVKRT